MTLGAEMDGIYLGYGAFALSVYPSLFLSLCGPPVHVADTPNSEMKYRSAALPLDSVPSADE